MRRDVLMPHLSDEVEEGVLVTWFVEPGGAVDEGALIAEVQVQKVSEEVLAPAAGRVAELLAPQGGVVRQGDPIAVLETGGESAGAEPAAVAAAEREERAPSTPAARRLARELGLDLGAVTGTGPGGRILESDVGAAAGGAGVARPAAGRLEPVTPMRRTIADRLQRHLATTAQLTLSSEADVTDLAERLEGLSEAWGRRASLTEAVVRACALALRNHPHLAARWTDEGLLLPERMDIGLAVALDEGLIVPVVRDAGGKDLRTLNGEIAGLAERARAGTLATAETEGGVFSVTNLGAYGIDAFTPLVNPPQTAVLGVGRARLRPAVVDGAVTPRMLMVLSLTFDHRVVDGAPAAAFLAEVVSLLQDPEALGATPD